MKAAGRISAPHTRALVVVQAGKILGERYAGEFTRNTPQLSWSQGKSIAAALVGAAIEAGHLDVGLDDSAPVPEWQGEGDPRREIRMRDLLNMSSGLDLHRHRPVPRSRGRPAGTEPRGHGAYLSGIIGQLTAAIGR